MSWMLGCEDMQTSVFGGLRWEQRQREFTLRCCCIQCAFRVSQASVWHRLVVYEAVLPRMPLRLARAVLLLRALQGGCCWQALQLGLVDRQRRGRVSQCVLLFELAGRG